MHHIYEKPYVTVCMAAFNASKHIREAIDSVQSQAFENWELICVDDGSKDSTASIIDSYVRQDSRIVLIRQDNQGPALARRTAYLAGSGEFFFSLDSDDFLSSDTLELLVSDALHSGCDIVMADQYISDPVTREYKSFSRERGMEHGDIVSGKEAFELTFPWVVNGRFLKRRKVVERNLGLENYFNPFNADEYLTRKFCLSARHLMFSRGAYFYRTNPGSLTRKFHPNRVYFFQTDCKLLELAVDENASASVVQFLSERVDGSVGGFAWMVANSIALRFLPRSKIFWAVSQVSLAAWTLAKTRRVRKEIKFSGFMTFRIFFRGVLGSLSGYLSAFPQIKRVGRSLR